MKSSIFMLKIVIVALVLSTLTGCLGYTRVHSFDDEKELAGTTVVPLYLEPGTRRLSGGYFGSTDYGDAVFKAGQTLPVIDVYRFRGIKGSDFLSLGVEYEHDGRTKKAVIDGFVFIVEQETLDQIKAELDAEGIVDRAHGMPGLKAYRPDRHSDLSVEN